MRPGEELRVTIEKLAFEGRALAHVDGMVVFVDGAVPGDVATIAVRRVKRTYAEARVVTIDEPSPDRVAPRCAHFGVCGGCAWQQLDYAAQLRWKTTHVAEALHHLAGLESAPVHDALACARPYYYRNKMEFSFSTARWLTAHETNTDPFTLGLHVPENYFKVLHIDACHLQSVESNRVLEATRAFVRARQLSIYHNKRHEGYLRFLAIRQSATTPDFMVNLVTSEDRPDVADAYAAFLQEQCPFVTTVVNNITARHAQISRGETERVVTGAGVIRERLGGLEFEISANAFFQTNTLQAERLYEIARTYARLEPADVVWDLYCGTGTIGLSMARAVRRVVGIEIVAEAVRDAARNAAHNGIANVEFLTGDLRALLARRVPQFAEAPSVVVVDPPRTGLHEDVVHMLRALAPPRLVYVSCNPATLARDLALFATAFTIDEVQPVDMFPHTWHIESVARLTRRAEHAPSSIA